MSVKTIITNITPEQQVEILLEHCLARARGSLPPNSQIKASARIHRLPAAPNQPVIEHALRIEVIIDNDTITPLP